MTICTPWNTYSIRPRLRWSVKTQHDTTSHSLYDWQNDGRDKDSFVTRLLEEYAPDTTERRKAEEVCKAVAAATYSGEYFLQLSLHVHPAKILLPSIAGAHTVVIPLSLHTFQSCD